MDTACRLGTSTRPNHHRPSRPLTRRRACSFSPETAVKIPPPSDTRRPANIPLHTLSPAVQADELESATLLGTSSEKPGGRRSSVSSGSIDSDFALWSGSEDLVDQLENEHDPLRDRLRGSLELQSLGRFAKGGGVRQPKRVRYKSEESIREKEPRSGVVKRKEDIPVPTPPPRKITFGEKVVAAIMAPGDGPSRIHGLHGKKLM